jgi:hypothetical protein
VKAVFPATEMKNLTARYSATLWKALGLDIPKNLQQLADQIIE